MSKSKRVKLPLAHELSDVTCAENGCSKKLKKSLLIKNPKAEFCYKCYVKRNFDAMGQAKRLSNFNKKDKSAENPTSRNGRGNRGIKIIDYTQILPNN